MGGVARERRRILEIAGGEGPRREVEKAKKERQELVREWVLLPSACQTINNAAGCLWDWRKLG